MVGKRTHTRYHDPLVHLSDLCGAPTATATVAAKVATVATIAVKINKGNLLAIERLNRMNTIRFYQGKSICIQG